jgi:branched-chain amino acid transport system substrate-binding protein
MKKTTQLLGLTAAAVLLMSAPVMAQGVKIGLLLGFSGPLEAMSPPMDASAKLAFDEVNAGGGIAGGQVTVVTADDGCITPDAAVAAADKLVNTDQVSALFGPMCTPVTTAVANGVTIPAGVLTVTPSGTGPAISSLADNDLVFRTTSSDAYNGEQMAKLLISKGIKDIGITYVNSDYGKGLADTVAAAFTAGGGKVAANVAHEEGKADYRAELGQIAASGTQTLVIIAYAQGSGKTALQQALESGDFTTYVGSDGMVNDELFTGLDAAALENMIAIRPGSPNSAGIDAFNAVAAAAGMDVASTYVPQSYDAAFLIAAALEKTGGKREGLSQALRDVANAPGEIIVPGEWKKAAELIKAGTDINYEGASGPVEFDANGDVAGVVIEMTVKGGKFAEVGPVM